MSDPLVETTQGKLKGKISRNCNNFPYYTFKGIPYARPPIGELRFTVTQPPEHWQGIRDATETCNFCAQLCKETKTVVGNEDCLYLNIYTPRLPSTDPKLLPVMVFFHGGGFLFGGGTDDSAHGPDFFIEKDVIVVSMNFRLGILGFLSLSLKEAPGNMGLMDQVQALKWIQRNIMNFSGNPNNVTIFGGSSGGASVGYLLLSPMAKGLFHKAIAQSASPLVHWAHNTEIKKLASKIPLLHDKNILDERQLLKYLKNLPTSELIIASLKAAATDEYKGGIHFGFVPTVEKPYDGESFLLKDPYELFNRGHYTKVPFMTGFCTREGLLMQAQFEKFLKSKVFIDYFPFNLNSTERQDMEIILKATYLDGETLHHDVDAYAIDFFTDVDFLGGVYVTAKLIAKNNENVYFYEFSFDGNLNYNKKCNKIVRQGACHGDEIGYLLKSNKLTDPISETDALVRETMTTLWTNFAKHGNPTPKLDHLIPIKWEPMKKDRDACLVIDKTLKNEVRKYIHGE